LICWLFIGVWEAEKEEEKRKEKEGREEERCPSRRQIGSEKDRVRSLQMTFGL